MNPDSTHLLVPLPPVSYVAKLTRSDIEEILGEWQRRLNLSHWRIKIDWEKDAPEFAEAEFSASDWYDSAEIMIKKGFEEWDRREANITIVHELVHVTLRDMLTAMSSVKSRLPKAAGDIWDDWVSAGQEKAVEHLAQVIVDLGGVV